MDATYDTVFVGAGHNALIAAAYLSRAGQRVLLIDRNQKAGGFVQSAELAPGIVYDTFAPPSSPCSPPARPTPSCRTS